jgi:tetratricopeptide (TPR) repeat protein
MKCPHCASSDTVWKAKAGKWECNSCEERFEGDSPENLASVSGGHPMPSAKAAKPKRIFFSYGHDANRELVDRFKADLEKRGHQVWIDYKEIGTWDDWKGTITRGIHDAELAIAFLSIHSTRDPGVCRNEVAMALQHFGKVYPVLVEQVPEESIPVTIAHLQWPDLSRWREFRDQEDLDFERFYEEKFLEIVSRVEGEAGRFASEAEVLRRALNPSGFEGRFARHLDGFTGREWVFDAFENWLDHQPSSRVFWIKAGPGFGKTALAVQMANRHRAAIVGTWFCDHQSVELRDPLRALQTIAYQLALRWDDYRVRLLPRLGLYADSSPERIEEARKELAKKSLQDLFSFLISEPMAGLIWREHKLVILVDALDEATEADGTNPLAALISGRFLELPEWIGFVVTSRPDASVVPYLQGFKPFAIEAGDDRNTADLQSYSSAHIGPMLLASERERLCNLLVEKSEGMMLYLRLVSEGLHEGTLAVENLVSLEAGLPGLHGRYHAGFEARFGKDFHDAVQPLLRLIMAAPGPMPLDLAAEVLEWDRELAVRTRARVGSYLVDDQGGLSLFHKTLGEWLGSESAALYFTDAGSAGKRLGTFLWERFDEREKDANDLTKPLRWEPFVRDWLPGLLEHTERRNDWVGIAELASWFREKVLWGTAEVLHRRTLEGRENALGPEHPDTLSSVHRLGGVLLAKGDYEGAELLFRRALEGREKALGTEHLDTIKSLGNLGIIQHQKGDREEAETIFHRCLESLEKALGPEHPSTLSGVNNYGSALNTKGNYATAELLHRRCLKGREKVLGPEHPDTLQSLSNFGNVLRKKGDDEEAEALFRLALKGREKVLGPEHPDTLQSLSNLGNVLRKKGDDEEAEALFRLALKGKENVLGKKHPDTLISMNNLGNLLSKKGDYEEAEALYRRALEGFENTLGQDHHQTLKCLEELADLLWNKGCRDEPEILSRRAFVGWERAVGLEHSNALSSMKMLGDILTYKLNFDGAEALFRRAFEHTQKVLGFEHPYTLECLTKLALLLPRKGDYVGAEIICRLAIDCGKNMSSAEYSNALAEHLERLFSSDRLRNAALAILRTFHICSDDRYYVSYTLGRYECINGYHEKAKHLIKEQLQQNPEKKKQALADADFAAIHEWISQI